MQPTQCMTHRMHHTRLPNAMHATRYLQYHLKMLFNWRRANVQRHLTTTTRRCTLDQCQSPQIANLQNTSTPQEKHKHNRSPHRQLASSAVGPLEKGQEASPLLLTRYCHLDVQRSQEMPRDQHGRGLDNGGSRCRATDIGCCGKPKVSRIETARPSWLTQPLRMSSGRQDG